MAEFLMPSLGADMESGTLLAWLKEPGDAVTRGDIIAVVETDKADVEVEVFSSGVLERLLVAVGEEVPVGTPLAVIVGPGETPAVGLATVPRKRPVPAGTPPALEIPTSAPPATPPSVSAADHRLLISPSARQLAEELGVDPETVRGSGPGGRIQRRDVEAAAAAPSARPVTASIPSPPPVAAAPLASGAASPREDRATAMRRAIASAMTRSKREIPHFYLGHSIDLSRTTGWLSQENLHRPVPDRVLLAVPMLKAVALALREVPELNQTWNGEEILAREEINVGVAISLRGGGLVAPAILGADRLEIDELMRAFRDLVSRARAGSLRSSEMSDPTITVTSLGERGAETVFGIIFPPQVAIVGFGAVVQRLWLSEGQPLPCPVVHASLAADHRVIDGHRASTFLLAVDRLLQEPETL
jgi:pyruvate dehydrogenase E2 component (dihydrolipoamide acetyltransferase)